MIHKAFRVTNDPLKLSQLSIDELHNQTKEAVATERDALVKVLHHLREVERRKLFSIYKRQSLFDYCVSELGYSEGAASRRIQAMRLIHEIPEVEEKVASGKLSLTNISQAQSFFREVRRREAMHSQTSLQPDLLHTTTHQGQLALSQKSHSNIDLEKHDFSDKLSKVNGTQSHMHMHIQSQSQSRSQSQTLHGADSDKKTAAEQVVRPKLNTEQTESFNEVKSINKLKVLENLELKSSRQGQKYLSSLDHSAAKIKESTREVAPDLTQVTFYMDAELKNLLQNVRTLLGPKAAKANWSNLILEMAKVSEQALLEKKFGKKGAKEMKSPELDSPPATPAPEGSANPRYISKETKRQLWIKYQGKCSRCSSKGNLNVDHIKPVHIGGSSNIENLRLLCFHCNQARHINSKTFLESPHRTKKRSSHVATS